MNHPILRYGAIATGILLGVNIFVLLLFGVPDENSYAIGEVVGYATIVLSLLPIFFALKYYRDVYGDGRLGFWKGVGIGAGISALPAVAFAIYNMIYVRWIDPEFTEKYLRYSLDKATESMSADQLQQYTAQLEAQQAMYSDPFFQGAIMFLTVFLIGMLITIASALLLQRKSETSSAKT